MCNWAVGFRDHFGNRDRKQIEGEYVMAIVDVGERVTNDKKVYNSALKSSKSYIYLEDGVSSENAAPATINLTVGNQWYNCHDEKFYQIPPKGIKVKPGRSVVLETKQTIGLPYNVFGIIFGTGKNIFRGGFVSTGKIDPSFYDTLKIGYYNGSNTTITFKTDDPLASCSFFDVETTLEAPIHDSKGNPAMMAPDTFFQKSKLWFSDNWYSVISIIVSILALIIAIK